jgi:hypothetical protein
MYGTVARFRLQPNASDKLLKLAQEYDSLGIPGFVCEQVYQMDADSNEYYLAVVFSNKETYFANSNTPQQHQRYLQMRALMTEEPEWHDGEVVYAFDAGRRPTARAW